MFKRWVVERLKDLLLWLLGLKSGIIDACFQEFEFLEALEGTLVELSADVIKLVVFE